LYYYSDPDPVFVGSIQLVDDESDENKKLKMLLRHLIKKLMKNTKYLQRKKSRIW